MRIGIISDTHGFLDQGVLQAFAPCDEIWHIGDVGSPEILSELEKLKPTIAVYGNIDGQAIRSAAPENQIFNRNGMKILLTHIAGKPPKYNARVKKLITEEKPDILVCGHSHILKVEMDKANNLLFMNPGAAGRQGFHKKKTLLRFSIQEGKARDLEVIDLGPRASIKT